MIAAVIALLLTGCAGEDESPPPTPLQRELRGLPQALADVHPEPFHDVSRVELQEAARKLADEAPELTHDELVVGVMRLASLGLRDGHTGVFPFDAHRAHLQAYPLQVYDFAGGLYVIGSIADVNPTGRRLTEIDGRPVGEVVELVRPLVPHDNESSLRWRLPTYLLSKEVLRGLGVTGSGRATFGFADGSSVQVEPGSAVAVGEELGNGLRNVNTGHDPVWLRDLANEQWLTTLEGGRVVYLGYRATTAATDDVAEQLAELAERPGVRRVIVDVRLNRGGDNTTYGALLDVLSRPAISEKLVLITGRETFSASGNFAADVARRTNARIVGELAGGAPSQWGDATTLELEQAGLTLRVATVYHDHGPPGSVRPDPWSSRRQPTSSRAAIPSSPPRRGDAAALSGGSGGRCA